MQLTVTHGARSGTARLDVGTAASRVAQVAGNAAFSATAVDDFTALTPLRATGQPSIAATLGGGAQVAVPDGATIRSVLYGR